MALTIRCPVCGKRDGYEFRYGGEDRGDLPDQGGIFHDPIFPEQGCHWIATSAMGEVMEWWCHKDGCGCWFRICRDTLSNCQKGGYETD